LEGRLLGAALPVLSISLDPGESVIAEAGEFSWMTDSIQMSAGSREPSEISKPNDIRESTGESRGAGQGVMGAPDAAAGASPPLPVSTYTARGAPGTVAFASKLPGRIVPVDVAAGGEYLVHRHGFLAAAPGVRVTTGFLQRFAAGVFAGEGFMLRRIGGTGRAWVALAGEVVSYDLAPGRSLRAHPGHVGMFEASVTCQIADVQGIVNRYFGAEHHFAVLSGPGTVWLQSLPLPLLAASIAPHLGFAVPRTAQRPPPAI
jgi:uncharacterized protein (AIM24 family)